MQAPKNAGAREGALHLLAEAAELEHNILCSYLYAAFSLKRRLDEGLSERELAAVERWRSQLMELCVEEMVHLAQVGNLMVAIGSRPHFNRPNLPVPPGYHPSGIAIGLLPFGPEALEHFLFLERPEEAAVPDAPVFAGAPGAERPEPAFHALSPRAPHYDTIGEFYEALRAVLEAAARELGEQRLFNGPAGAQLTPREIRSPDLVVIRTLADARRAIDFIVEQGEGSGGARDGSHFSRFEAMRDELAALRSARPAFEPARAAARDPVMHPPAAGEERIWISAARAARALDAGNAVYAAMLRCLASLYEIAATEPEARQAMLGASMACMGALAAVGCALSELPATDEGPLPTAGLSFAMPRAIEGLLPERAAPILAERLAQIADALGELDIEGEEMARAAGSLAEAAAALKKV